MQVNIILLLYTLLTVTDIQCYIIIIVKITGNALSWHNLKLKNHESYAGNGLKTQKWTKNQTPYTMYYTKSLTFSKM